MPELPEVETICRGLSHAIAGSKLIKVQNFRDNLRFPFPEGFAERLKDRQIKNITRRAKYILINLDNGTTLMVHLGMSGCMVVHQNLRNCRDKHDHVIFHNDQGKEIVFNDPRRFGMMDIVVSDEVNNHKLIKDLGVEPLLDAFNGEVLFNLLRNRKVPVKLAIMNANLVVGVGNIYACESLFSSNISPLRQAGSLSLKECATLAAEVKKVLLEAIKAGGSTLKDFVASSGESGYFQHNFKVYGRDGQKCVSCSGEIKRVVQGGRSTFYCGKCQS